MRPFETPSPGSMRQEERWILEAFDQLSRLSQEPEDAQAQAQEYTITGTLTQTRTLDLATPTVANLAAVLATFLTDLQNAR